MYVPTTSTYTTYIPVYAKTQRPFSGRHYMLRKALAGLTTFLPTGGYIQLSTMNL